MGKPRIARAKIFNDQFAPAVVDFLRPLMPRKGKAELYTAIGLQKFGKAEFYRGRTKNTNQQRLEP